MRASLPCTRLLSPSIHGGSMRYSRIFADQSSRLFLSSCTPPSFRPCTFPYTRRASHSDRTTSNAESFTHLRSSQSSSSSGESLMPTMVDVSEKRATKRTAHAQSIVRLPHNVVSIFSLFCPRPPFRFSPSPTLSSSSLIPPFTLSLCVRVGCSA